MKLQKKDEIVNKLELAAEYKKQKKQNEEIESGAELDKEEDSVVQTVEDSESESESVSSSTTASISPFPISTASSSFCFCFSNLL